MANGLTPNIKQIMLADGAHDIEALHFFVAGSTLDDPASWKQYIDDAAAAGFQFIVSTEAENTPAGVKFTPKGSSTEVTGTLSAEDASKAIYLVYHPHDVNDAYDEYIAVGETGAKAWEKIGNTDIDLSDYAKKTEAGKADTYTTAANTIGVETGEAGGETATVVENYTYDKAANETGEAENHEHTVTGTVTAEGTIGVGAGAANYTPAGTISAPDISLSTVSQTVATEGIKAVTSTFNGTAATISMEGNVTGTAVEAHAAQTLTISGSQTVADHDHTATQTVTDDNKATVVGSITDFSGGEATFTQGTDSFTTNVPTAIDTTKFSGGSLTGTTTFNTDAIKSATIEEDTTSDFKFSTDAISNVTVASTTVASDIEFNIPSNAIKSAGLTDDKTFFKAATVSTDGVLSFTNGTVGITYTLADNQGYKLNRTTAQSKGIKITTAAATSSTVGFTAAAFQDGFYTAGSAATFTQGTDTFNFTAATMTTNNATVIKSLPSITIGNNGGFTISGSNFEAALPTLSHTVTDGSVSLSTTYTPAGSISNTYTAAGTANINLVTGAALANAPVFTGTGVELTFTGSAVDIAGGKAAAAGAHTHTIELTNTAIAGEGTVTIANHTHSIAAHTHTVVIAPIATAAV